MIENKKRQENHKYRAVKIPTNTVENCQTVSKLHSHEEKKKNKQRKETTLVWKNMLSAVCFHSDFHS